MGDHLDIIPCAVLLGMSGWRSGHHSRLPPLLQVLYVDWVSVHLNLTSRVSSGHSGFLPPQKLTHKNRTPFKLALLNWTFLYKYWPLLFKLSTSVSTWSSHQHRICFILALGSWRVLCQTQNELWQQHQPFCLFLLLGQVGRLRESNLKMTYLMSFSYGVFVK